MQENTNTFNQLETGAEPKIKPKTQLKPDDWLCIVCRKMIASDKDRFAYDGKTEFQFTNPNGYIFDIVTFGKADGCREMGERTMDFTWFAGHAWSFAHCIRCGAHLGWKYSGDYSFYGLIKTRLVKGETLLN